MKKIINASRDYNYKGEILNQRVEETYLQNRLGYSNDKKGNVLIELFKNTFMKNKKDQQNYLGNSSNNNYNYYNNNNYNYYNNNNYNNNLYNNYYNNQDYSNIILMNINKYQK